MKFDKTNFTCNGGYLKYNDQFVARFKHNRRDAAGFKSFLVKNFSVEEYFEMAKTLAPAEILQTKGYVSKTVQTALVKMGYEPTLDGFNAYLSRGVK